MRELIKRLKQLRTEVNLSERFSKVVLDEKLFSAHHFKKIARESCAYEQNILLKKMVYRMSNRSFNNYAMNFWIVNGWGGIKNFKKTPNTKRYINRFERELKEGKLSPQSFGTISSLSKIASFIENKKFVIYDSRVVYSLNWLLLEYAKDQVKYFPMPTSRNV